MYGLDIKLNMVDAPKIEAGKYQIKHLSKCYQLKIAVMKALAHRMIDLQDIYTTV